MDRSQAKRRDAPPIGATPRMTDKQFKLFSDFITAQLGIKLPPAKKTMLEARLQKRLRVLGMASHEEYCDYLFSPAGLEQEMPHLFNVVTTNTTHFFREPKHFDILAGTVLPEWFARHGRGKRLELWSAGCSTGEEPYTLGMVMNDFAANHPGFHFAIMASDISLDVLRHASRAV